MLLVPCLNCYTVVRVFDDVEKSDSLVGPGSEFWPDKYTCVSCNAACQGIEENEASLEALSKMKVRDLSSEEMFAAQNGLGTPEEMLCDAATVRDLLLHNKIKMVGGETVRGTTRFCLTHIELETGVKLWFGSAPSGAIVFKITRPLSYTQRVLDEAHD